MTESTTVVGADVSRFEAHQNILAFVEQHATEVSAWLAEQFQDSYLYPEFLREFQDDYLPWLWEVEELAELAAAGDMRALMKDWDEHMDLHPDRSESF